MLVSEWLLDALTAVGRVKCAWALLIQVCTHWGGVVLPGVNLWWRNHRSAHAFISASVVLGGGPVKTVLGSLGLIKVGLF